MRKLQAQKKRLELQRVKLVQNIDKLEGRQEMQLPLVGRILQGWHLREKQPLRNRSKESTGKLQILRSSKKN
ncbi:hypothetical protein [Methanosarcina barkeri]|uniref:hypothetical protein n=1 Tax=Methanosarcina barkeri TaxID=2208 RepID=UPI001FB3DBA1|nr:hypothetical protein [Methanosarcina barkeri]